jgi:Tol biopolymer transport system component
MTDALHMNKQVSVLMFSRAVLIPALLLLIATSACSGSGATYSSNSNNSGSSDSRCPRLPTPVPPSDPLPFKGHIAITLSCGYAGQQEIYIINADGSGVFNLTNHPADDLEFSWSPDGKHIAFASDRDGNMEIYTIAISGTELTRLTYDSEEDRLPRWSPDGEHIMFMSRRDRTSSDEAVGELYLMRADGSEQRRVYYNVSEPSYYVWAAWPEAILGSWSPDGQHFATTYRNDIFIFHLDGSEPTNLTNHPASDMKPQWSPDGKNLLFLSNRNQGEYEWEIYVFNFEEEVTIHIARSQDQRPKWSPDGQSILFTNRSTGNDDLYIVNWDGTGLTNITNHLANDFRGTWSSDGQHIAFFSGRDGHGLTLMNADGTEQIGILLDFMTHEHGWAPQIKS